MKKPSIILIGGGGHCLSAIDVIEKEGKFHIKGILDKLDVSDILGYPILGDDSHLQELIADDTFFLITVGQIKTFAVRERIAIELKKKGAQFATVISPLAYVSRYAIVEEGTIIMHGAMLNAEVKIGKNCIINTKSNIEHGVVVGDFCHISTCSVVNGDSVIERGVFLGSNSTISNGVTISENSIISAGKFVKR